MSNKKVYKSLPDTSDYFEYEGYLVMKAKLPWVGTHIYKGNGEWDVIRLTDGDTKLFPMDHAKALDILNNGYPILAK